MSLLVLLNACATSSAPSSGAADDQSSIGAVASGLDDVYLAEAAVIDPNEFVDKPIGNLEALLGAPAFVRQEGVGEFRRYDTTACRIYAVLTAESGDRPLVRTISIGALKANAPAPTLGECLVNR